MNLIVGAERLSQNNKVALATPSPYDWALSALELVNRAHRVMYCRSLRGGRAQPITFRALGHVGR